MNGFESSLRSQRKGTQRGHTEGFAKVCVFLFLIFGLNSGNHYFKDQNRESSPANHFFPELVFCCFSSLK